MTIRRTLDAITLMQCKNKAIAEYSNNVFFKQNTALFIKLLYAQAMNSKISIDLKFADVKCWLLHLYSTDASNIRNKLSIDDRILLVMNGIEHLPGCKCELKKLRSKA